VQLLCELGAGYKRMVMLQTPLAARQSSIYQMGCAYQLACSVPATSNMTYPKFNWYTAKLLEVLLSSAPDIELAKRQDALDQFDGDNSADPSSTHFYQYTKQLDTYVLQALRRGAMPPLIRAAFVEHLILTIERGASPNKVDSYRDQLFFIVQALRGTQHTTLCHDFEQLLHELH
jgi:hypothetical protein